MELDDDKRREVEIAILEQMIDDASAADRLLSDSAEENLLELLEDHDLEIDYAMQFINFVDDVKNKGQTWWRQAIRSRQEQV